MDDYNALDDDARNARAEARKVRDLETRTQEQIDLALLMDEPHGRRIAYRFLEEAGVFRMSYTQGDPHATAFKEGQRNIGNWLLSQLMKDTPEHYALMLKEKSDAA